MVFHNNGTILASQARVPPRKKKRIFEIRKRPPSYISPQLYTTDPTGHYNAAQAWEHFGALSSEASLYLTTEHDGKRSQSLLHARKNQAFLLSRAIRQPRNSQLS